MVGKGFTKKNANFLFQGQIDQLTDPLTNDLDTSIMTPERFIQTDPLRVFLHGASGRMGLQVEAEASRQPNDCMIVGRADRGSGTLSSCQLGGAHVAIDFSTPEGACALARSAREASLPLLCATTGLTVGQRAEVLAVASVAPVMIAPNTSLGVAVAKRVAAVAARLLDGYAVEISEAHHIHKKDRPSGTALSLAESVAAGGGARVPADAIAVTREGETIGHHEVHFVGTSERLSIIHDAGSRGLFAEGALRLARWLVSQPPGAWSIDDWLDSLGAPRLSTRP